MLLKFNMMIFSGVPTGGLGFNNLPEVKHVGIILLYGILH